MTAFASLPGRTPKGVAQQLKDRKPIVIDDDGFAVDEARLYWKAFEHIRDAREAVGDVVAAARDQPTWSEAGRKPTNEVLSEA